MDIVYAFSGKRKWTREVLGRIPGLGLLGIPIYISLKQLVTTYANISRDEVVNPNNSW